MTTKSILSILLAASVALCGCHSGHGHEGHEVEEHEEHEHGHSGNPDIISFSPERQQIHGIVTDTVRTSQFSAIIPATGEILPSTGSEMTVIAPASGKVTLSSAAVEGKDIQKGTVIASVSTEGFLSDQPSVKIKAEYESARAAFQRDSALYRDEIVSATHFEQTRTKYLIAKSAYDALGSSGAKGMSARSGISGFLRKLLVTNGQFVEEGDAIAIVTTSGKNVLKVLVPERYASQASTVRSAVFIDAEGRTIDLDNYSGRVASGARSSENGYIPISFEFDNRADVLTGTYADVRLRTEKSDSRIVIPLSAVTESQGIHSVFVRLDEDCFERRTVKLAGSDGINAAVEEGLKEGEIIVTEGATIIKLASVSSVPAGHTHSH